MTLSDRLHHVGVVVADLEAAVAWYAAHLDFAVELRFALNDGRLRIVKLVSPGGVRVELLRFHDGPERPSRDGTAVGAQHVCFAVDSAEATAAELRRRGVPLVQEPRVIAESQEVNLWVADGEGNLIEFIESLGAASGRV